MSEAAASHENPIWRDRANAIVRAEIEDGGWEQLWARDLNGQTVALCCIPFFTYGFALGDEVRVEDYVIRGLARPSGHRTIRVWLEEDELGPTIAQDLGQLGALMETRGHLLALDAANDETAGRIMDLLAPLEESQSLRWELGN